jgi:dTMP kinase
VAERGLFLVLEGVEGAGKSTQARRLAEWIGARGREVVLTREPGGTDVGEAIRRVLLEGPEMPARSELLLMLAARAALVDQVIRPALKAGKVVVADRFDLSTLAYQGAGRDLGQDRVGTLNAFAVSGIRPDLTILLEIEASSGAARKRRGGSGPDRIERETKAFHERVAEAYRTLAASAEQTAIVDARPAQDAVQQAIREVLRARFPETFRARAG